jgi:ABC-type microcin C transport system permease subunit YejE
MGIAALVLTGLVLLDQSIGLTWKVVDFLGLGDQSATGGLADLINSQSRANTVANLTGGLYVLTCVAWLAFICSVVVSSWRSSKAQKRTFDEWVARRQSEEDGDRWQ